MLVGFQLCEIRSGRAHALTKQGYVKLGLVSSRSRFAGGRRQGQADQIKSGCEHNEDGENARALQSITSNPDGLVLVVGGEAGRVHEGHGYLFLKCFFRAIWTGARLGGRGSIRTVAQYPAVA